MEAPKDPTAYGLLTYAWVIALSFDGGADVESFKWNSNGIKFATGKTVDYYDTASTVGSAGGASALPATPSGYITIKVQGTNYKVPYYAT